MCSWSQVGWTLRYSTIFFHCALSLFQAFLILVWSLEFEIWGRSNPWLLRYSTINILRSSSIGGCLPFKHFVFGFGPLVLSLEYEEDPIIGWRDISPLVFWGLHCKWLYILVWSHSFIYSSIFSNVPIVPKLWFHWISFFLDFTSDVLKWVHDECSR